MGFVKKTVRKVTKPFVNAIKGVVAPEIDTSAQEAAAREAAAAQRQASEQAAQQARWQAQATANQQATMLQREQLQQSAMEQPAFDDEAPDVRVGQSSSTEAARRRKQFSPAGTSSQSPSIRI